MPDPSAAYEKITLNGSDEDDKLLLEEALKQGIAKLTEEEKDMKKSPKILPNTPSYRHFRLVSIPEEYSNITRLGQLSEEVTKYFLRERPSSKSHLWSVDIAANEEFKDYCLSDQQASCQESKYRRFDGSCNNLGRPYDWGTAMRPFLRLLPPDYCDGVSKPRCGSQGKLPAARDVTLKLHRSNYKSDHKFNFMFAVWGQFIDHDITATAVTKILGGEMTSCCESEGFDNCYPVRLGEDDPIYILYNTSCMEFVRSAAAPRCNLGPREQLNQVTSFLDGSVIYGSSRDLADQLRSFKAGRMAVTSRVDGGDLLPVSTDLADGCNRDQEAKKGRYCFIAGDRRANENLHLTTLHLIMVRQHNRIAAKLLETNPHWNDETVYQEAKKIVAAQVQHITYNEFLDPLLGPQIMKRYRLTVKASGHDTKYDETSNPNIANSFATSSFRFAHSLLPGLMKSYETTSPETLTLLRQILFNPFPLYSPGSLERILMSAVGTDVQKPNRFFSNEVTQHLFEEPQNSTAPKICGLDLVSLNIQRGRDHGLPAYTKWRKYCSLSPVGSFEDLASIMDEGSIEAIKQLYNSVEDIDLYSGSLSEKPLEESILGPTASCLIAEQFKRIKTADRFWYENDNGPHSFTKDQLNEIKKTTLASVVCANSVEITNIPKNLLMFPSENNESIKCADLHQLDFKFWVENSTYRCSMRNCDETLELGFRSRGESHLTRAWVYTRLHSPVKQQGSVLVL